MDLQERFDAILCVSTIEHIGQGETPTREYGESARSGPARLLPLQAVAKIYDLLNDGGHGLITTPCGELLDGEWYIQSSPDYLELLHTVFGIPKSDMHVRYLKRVSMEVGYYPPSQVWAEATAKEMQGVEYGFPFATAGGIAVISLHKTRPYSYQPDLPEFPGEILKHLKFQQPVLLGSLYFSQVQHVHPSSPDGWIQIAAEGYMWHGPYIDLPKGVYVLELELESAVPASLCVDIMSEIGDRVWLKEVFFAAPTATIRREVAFPEGASKMQLRLSHMSAEANQVKVHKLRFEAKQR